MSIKGLIRRHPRVHHAIKHFISAGLHLRARRRGRPAALIPAHLKSGYTMNGRVEILYAYVDGSQTKPLVYSSRIINANCERIARGELGHYGAVDAWLYNALQRFPVRGQRVLIVGSADQGYGPWYECICLQHGGQPTTVDYNPIEYNDPRIRFIKAPVREALAPFDAAFSISSFEHDGLGRYGDPLDPNADLKAMRQMKEWIKPGGLLFLAVPVGKDKVVFNYHRIYGPARMPVLVQNWTVLERFGYDEGLLDRDTQLGWQPKVCVAGPTGQEERLMHPECPEYSPIWVLRND